MTDRPGGGTDQMLSLVEALPAQLAASSGLPGRQRLRPLPSRPRQIVLCGMGGSAIAGDLLAPVLREIDVPFAIWRDYGLPHWADGQTLVIASSYSGNTEETLSAVRAARERNCSLIAVTSGGQLLAETERGSAGESSFPCLRLPEGLPPRASVGFGVGAVLWGLHGLGLIGSPEGMIGVASEVLNAGNRVFQSKQADGTNPAQELAGVCRNRFVAIYTTSPEAHGAGLRLKAQLNENAKTPASTAALPELNHNDIVGWRMTPTRRDAFVLVFVRSSDETERAALRVSITKDLLQTEFAAVEEIQARGEQPLARILSLVQFGDYLSCYLAMAQDVDPVPVERIDVLKQRLLEGR